MISRAATLRLGVCAGLSLITLAVFWPVLDHQFVNYDDNLYVTANPYVRAGLTPEGLGWAWSTGWAANWHPLTWMSHMLDVELFGLDPAGHHLTSLLLHVINSVVLFLLLERMTGASLRSAIVALLFAVHPLHVESVAWVAERKDVLSTLFWLLTTWAYLAWTRSPGPLRYTLLVVTFALGLAAKPMLVTLPFALLLLDIWPLGRWPVGQRSAAASAIAWARIREKTPLFALAAASSLVTFLVQRAEQAVVPMEVFSLPIRVANAVVAYASYLWKTLWPSGLIVFYPHPGAELGLWPVVLSAAVLAAITVLVVRAFSRQPYLLVGWLWYLGTLVPVIGLVQVGAQAMADRYTYVPLIGLFVASVWGIADGVGSIARRPLVARVLAGSLCLVIPVLGLVAHAQAGYWRDSATLFGRAVEVDPRNAVAHTNLGQILAARGRIDEAVEHYRVALEVDASRFEARTNLAHALARQGRLEEAEEQLRQVLRERPDYPEAINCRGILEFERGRPGEASEQFLRALELKPWYADAHANLGLARARQGRYEEAAEHYREALRYGAASARLHELLGEALVQLGDRAAAEEQFRLALRLEPGHAAAIHDLALLLAAQGKTEEAIARFREAVRAAPDDAEAHYNLGTLLAQSGDFARAVEHLSLAIEIREGYAMAHYNLGAVLLQMGDRAGAKREIETARRLGYPP